MAIVFSLPVLIEGADDLTTQVVMTGSRVVGPNFRHDGGFAVRRNDAINGTLWFFGTANTAGSSAGFPLTDTTNTMYIPVENMNLVSFWGSASMVVCVAKC